MSDDRPTLASNPPARRFGPVTWLAGVCATIFGIFGAVLARVVGHPDYLRGILVTSIFCGAALGVAAGMLVEQNKVPRFFRRVPWNWFRFNLLFVVVLMTLSAAYLGLISATAGMLDLRNQGPFRNLLLAQLIYQGPLALVCIAGVAALINRWHVHPRVSMLALIGIGGLALTSAMTTMITMLSIRIARAGSSDLEFLMLVRSIFHWLSYPICFGLILIAVLIDRGDQRNKDELPRTRTAD